MDYYFLKKTGSKLKSNRLAVILACLIILGDKTNVLF